MNTTVSCTLLCTNEEHAAGLEKLTRQWFSHMERRFSRFLPDSELTHLNLMTGELCMVSATMLEVLTLADAFRRLTDGVFNPFILHTLLEYGYNESFEHIRSRTSEVIEQPDAHIGADSSVIPHAANKSAALRAGVDSIHPQLGDQAIIIDAAMQSVRLPPGSSIDLGGIVKGWAVRRLAALLRSRHGVKQGFINAGGDLALWGAQAEPWKIAVDYPWPSSEAAGHLILQEGAVATSGTLGRRWQSYQGTAHHLINPFTKRPSSSDVLQCTVTGDDTAACDIWAKTICILGSAEGLALMQRKTADCGALLILKDGTTLLYNHPHSCRERREQWRHTSSDRMYVPDKNWR
ncbi:FAD:protein FMN transferase [Paenibacillus solisilvae]|uniref:FAD:protein FMN transferase n=1 Tax=Paenibacillus solisilvae TaxID=2486751 RepID=A0ABW0W680_9BACL